MEPPRALASRDVSLCTWNAAGVLNHHQALVSLQFHNIRVPTTCYGFYRTAEG